METHFTLEFYTKHGWSSPLSLIYPGDIYIEIEQATCNESYAIEVQAWAEEAQSGDIYDDGSVRVVAL